MTKINWRIRIKNPVFWVQLGLSVLVPVLAYMGISMEELTTWGMVGEVLLQAVSNPYILGLAAISVWNAIIDPTTTGITDSARALSFQEPNKDK